MTGQDLSTEAGPSTASVPQRPRRTRRIETLAAAWWATGAVFLAVDAAAFRASVGAAVVDPQAINSGLLRDVPANQLSLGLATYALLGAVAAAWMRWGATRPRAVRVATLAASGVVVLGAVVIVDATVLAGLGYLPALLVTAPFSARTRDALGTYVQPDMLFQVAVLVGVVALATAVVRFARRTAGACERCGRRHDTHDPGWTTPAAAARWGRVAALVAAAVPAFYAATRLAWAAGIPLGFPREDLHTLVASGGLLGALGLGTFALVGAVLTLGLYQRWGEVFPRWVVGLAGRRVPVGLAVVPATLVAVAVLPAGVSLIALGLQEGLLSLEAETWAATGPGLLWPLWSLALGAATYAYWLRRRGPCAVCGRG